MHVTLRQRTEVRRRRTDYSEPCSSVVCSQASGRRSFRCAHTLQPELTLAPDHEQTRRGDDRGADEDVDSRQFGEEEIAEQKGPHHRGVVEGRHQGGGRQAVALGEQDMGEPTAQPDRHQRRKLGPCRHQPAELPARQQPAERPGCEPGERTDQREIEHDRRGRLGLGEAAGLDHRARIAERPADRKGQARRGPGGADVQ